MTTLIENVRVISPGIDLTHATIEMSQGRIQAVHPQGSALPASTERIDASGLMAMPGFFDIHAHGADGCDTVDCQLSSIRHIAKRKLDEGVTTWLPTTLTLPQEQLLAAAQSVADYQENAEFARTPGLHVEGPFINPKCTGAQNPAFVREPNFSELLEIHQIVPALIVSLAPEMPGATAFIREASALGIRCSAAHTAATHADFLTAKTAGLAHLTHFCNQMSPLHHREIGVVGSGLLDQEIRIEIICDGIHLAPDMLRTVFALKNIEQMMLITDSMAGSWIENGDISLGGLPVTVENGIARVTATGALAGSTLKFNEGVRIVHELTGIPLSQLVKATSWNQAQSLGLHGFGKLEAGYHADLVLLDSNFQVQQTWVDGLRRR